MERQTGRLHYLHYNHEVGGRRCLAHWSDFPVWQALALQGCDVRAVEAAQGGYPFCSVVMSPLRQSWQKHNMKSTAMGSSAPQVKTALSSKHIFGEVIVPHQEDSRLAEGT